jgi:CheY-like chemotaxis protein
MHAIARTAAAGTVSDAESHRTRLIAVLVHELRNPLAPIRNAVEVLRLCAADSDPVMRCSDLIDRQVTLLTSLLDDLQAVGRMRDGSSEVIAGQVDLRGILEQALRVVAPLIAERGLGISTDLPPGDLQIQGDSGQLTRLFTILLDNAARYTDEGGRITVRLELRGADAVATVTDSGIGLSPELQRRLFEPFAVAESELGTGNRLGLGLPLAYGIAVRHGGTLEAHSQGPGHGSEFTVRLPLCADDPPGDRSGREPEPSRHWRIVLADDLPLNADSLSDLLRQQAHEVVTAYDGEAAVAAAERLRPDAIVLDLGMPGIDGYEACRRIRAQPWGQEPIIIALTGWGQADARARTRDAGFTHHMLKPVHHQALLGMLNRLRRERAGSSAH